ncbi:glycoside hydrolase family 2 protein [Sanguibacter suaedae]|uniref:Glycoside hydrolase family 2 n=1 Tax=Sanguibacter suaedae TaxID=2795737 RepID=A0A934IAG8_9MICO|nr:glycoside hydrolase family 2 TIM barrel-domain containing protein [Sanguibacter suaedae]MBI9114338.1 glycoside hydrolase family 2 [Sanguibacter suaedae]
MTQSTGTSTPLRASTQDGSYPRPQMVRAHWTDLSGPWEFQADDADRGRTEGWQARDGLDGTITVPFPPESPASGVGDTGFHPVLWYRREITEEELLTAGLGTGRPVLLVHLGAVDHAADVWLNGVHLGSHVGGSTPFIVDATAAVDRTRSTQSLVVRAQDDPLDVEQHRGKQDWFLEPHSIWYHRTSGIWQPVWLEAVPELAVARISWTPDLVTSTVAVAVELSRRPSSPVRLRVVLDHEGTVLADQTVVVDGPRAATRITLDGQRNGQHYESLLWSPERPTLVDARIELLDAPATGAEASAGTPRDVVVSYLGLRSAAVGGGHFLLNDRPYYVRSVLNQGFWPETHLAAPSADALRDEVRLIKDLGFNATRVHQKIEDPRFLYWADRLGLLVWAEAPSAYQFSSTAVHRMVREWTEVIERDVSHPCIVTWVPFNESWGVQHVAHDPAMRHYVQSLWHLTKSLDPSRPVVSNDGWELTDSDVWSVHDYDASPERLAARYADKGALAGLLAGRGPAGRTMRLTDEPDRGQPVMLTEFGGITFAPGEESETWGYSRAGSSEDLAQRLRALMTAVHGAALAGFCYTQLADTLQEANGLVTADRRPKVPAEELRAIMSGQPSREDG